MEHRPIFFDHTGKRWKRILRFSSLLALVISIVGAAFSFSIMAVPMSPLRVSSDSYIHRFIPRLESHEEAARRFVAHKESRKVKEEIARENDLHAHKRHTVGAGETYSTTVGFYVNWDPGSLASLRRHIDKLTYIMPEWLTLNKGLRAGSDKKLYSSRFIEKTDSDVKRLSATHKVPIIPMIDNFDSDTKTWDWPRLRKLLIDTDAQQQLAEDLRDELKDQHYAGINLDFEFSPTPGMTKKEQDDAKNLLYEKMPKFVRLLKQYFAPEKLLVTQDLLASDLTMNYESLGDIDDLLIVMFYDQHWATGEPGPIASQAWIENIAEKVFQRVDGHKVILGLANYCYDWPVKYDKNGNLKAAGPAQAIGLGPALAIARDAQTKVLMDDKDLNPHFYYHSDKDDSDHVAYMLDAITAYNALIALKGYEPCGAALWVLGREDPSIWSFFSDDRLGQPVKKERLEKLNYVSEVNDEGNGDILEVVEQPSPGIRKLQIDSDGLIRSEDYTEYPSPYLIRQTGYHTNEVALTFDDGPDPKFTPQILRILRKNGIKATFFVIGSNAERYPELVRECWQSGNEIGNHTFSHPHISEVGKLRAELEVNSTQRIIEALTGHSSRLFRPPFGEGSDSNVETSQDADLLVRTQNLGYVTVGMEIDPKDYERPNDKLIVDSVCRSLPPVKYRRIAAGNNEADSVLANGAKGSVILLHDSGGDRSHTVKALPLIIKDLKQRGYKFVTVSQLIPDTPWNRIFPSVAQNQLAITGLDQWIFEISFAVSRVLQIIFFISILLGVLRLVVITPLALSQSRQSKKLPKELKDYAPPVTVLIPAYNEGKVVCRTIQAVLDSDYPSSIRVLVIDDGSTDDTAEIVSSSYANDDRVTLIRKENGGKASALNLGIEKSDTEVLVCLDADTVFDRNAIARLARHFADPRVGAVAGNVKVGNRNNPLTTWQSLEYITSQNFDRRAYAAFNAVSVVPGAVGAWRRSAVLKVGGYHNNTLAEDADLTFRLQVQGWHIRTENDALAYTEVPDTVMTLAKQRFRWAYGILQSLWKHRKSMFKPSGGAFSMFVMPSMWVYNIFFQAFSPIVDIMVVISLFSGGLLQVLSYYAAFFVLDFIGAAIAFQLDHEDPKQLIWLFWQRLFYRQFMYYIIICSIIAALRGAAVGWGKLQRKATATLPE
ncbi:MAG: polysaccharide deacetylase family protein [Armatimonadota bacterium]